MPSESNIVNMSALSRIGNFFKTIWKYIKLFFVYIFKGIDYFFDLTFGNLIKLILKLFNFDSDKIIRIRKTSKKIIWVLFIITFIIVNNIIFNNILFDYTVYYPYKWVMDGLSAVFDALSKAFTESGNENAAVETLIYHRIFNEWRDIFWNGIKVTIHLSLVGTVIGFIIALLFSALVTLKITDRDSKAAKIFKYIGKYFVKLYVTVIRSTPMMVQAMIFFWGLKGILSWDPLTAALFTVSINTAAYLTEVLRGAITSIDKGQTEAARSLGLSTWKTTFGVIYPQAIKNAMPSIGNEFVINIKDTSVLSVILVVDIFRVAELIQGRFGQAFPPYLVAAFIYLVITIIISVIIRVAERKLELPAVALPSAN